MTKRRTTVKKFTPGRGYTKADWDEVADNPKLTAKEIANMKPFAETFPELAESIKRSRGRPRVDEPKEAVTLRIPAKTLARYKGKGENWRAQMVKAIEKGGR